MPHAPVRRCARHPMAVAALLIASASLTGCGEEPSRTPSKTQRTGSGVPDQDLTYLDEIAALGYVDRGESEAEIEPSGVRHHDPEAAWDGISLYVSLPDCAAYLIDMAGEVVHGWRGEPGRNKRWSRVELLPNGDVVCIAPKENELIRLAWDGTERWRVELDAHHDVRWSPEDEIVLLTRSLRRLEQVHPTRLVVDNAVARLDGRGQLLAEHSLFDLLSTDARIVIAAPDNVDQAPAGMNVDPIHANTLEPVRFEHLADRSPIYARGNVLLTLRYTCAVAMVDLEEQRVLWFWGPGEIEGPHDATLLENGHVLLLDNGWVERGFSRVLEVDPLTDRILWEYRAPTPSDFFTSGRGTVQPLPNGNVLVGNSNSGEAFEITREKRMVWRFLNPSVDENGGRGVLRIRRFAREEIEGIARRAGG